MLNIDPNAQPYLKSLTTCLQRLAEEGYTEEFQVMGKGLLAAISGRFYTPETLDVVNCFHFKAKGKNNAAALFMIQAKDGTKGTLVDNLERESGPLGYLLHQCGKRNQ